MLRYLLLILFALFAGFTAFAQDPAALSKIADVYGAIWKKSQENPQTLRRLSYNITTVFTDSAHNPNSRSKCEVLASANFLYVKTDYLELWEDKESSVMVVKETKTLCLSDSQLKSHLAKYADSLLQNQQNQLKSLKVTHTSTKDGILRVQTVPTQAEMQKMMKGYHFAIDEARQHVKEVVCIYLPIYPIQRVKMEFDPIVFDYKGFTVPKSVKSRFFTPEVKLKPPYEGYRLIDARKKK